MGALWRQWRDVLAKAGNSTAALDAKWLAAEALHLSDIGLVRAEADEVAPEAEARLAAMMARRLRGESVARIIGEREFYGLAFTLNAATLEPRPDTELLVDLALKALPNNGRLLDLGTGTGCIPISILVNRPDASGIATDLSEAALKAARHNAGRHGVEGRLTFSQGSWFGALPPLPASLTGGAALSSASVTMSPNAPVQHLPLDGGGREGVGDRPDAAKFHLITSNPPYIASSVIPTLSPEVQDFDPALALDGGPDGLDPYRIIIAQAPDFLLPGGQILLEIGYDQGQAVSALLAGAGFSGIVIHKDFGGLDRVASAHHI